jgi:hypothetical protein
MHRALSKIIVYITCVFFIVSCGTTAQDKPASNAPLRITERGASFEEAKRRAFRRAVEMRVGVLMVGERITINQDFQEKIYSYSSGFIQDYRHLSTERRDGSNFETFDIWVKDSAVADGLLTYQPSSVSLDGKKLLETVRSRDAERESGELLLARVLNGWPNNAVKASLGSYRVSYELDRSVVLNLQGINISWNEAFEKSLREVLDRVAIESDGNRRFYTLGWNRNYSAVKYVMGRETIEKAPGPSGLTLSEVLKDKFYRIGDNGQMTAIHQAFQRDSFLRIVLRDRSKNTLDQYCVLLEGMRTSAQANSMGPGQADAHWTEIPKVPRFIADLKFNLSKSNVERLNDVEISVVSKGACKGV